MTRFAPRRGDLIWVDFGAASEREQAGRRPALVVSTDAYNASSSVLIVCPLSAGGKPWPFCAPLSDTDDAKGWVLVDQVKVIDPVTRHGSPLGKVGAETMTRVDQLLAALLELPDPATAP